MDLHCELPIHICFCQLCNTAQPSLVHCVKCSNYFCQCSAVCTVMKNCVQWKICQSALALYKSAAPADISLQCCVQSKPLCNAEQYIKDCILGNTLQLTIIRNVYRKVQSVPLHKYQIYQILETQIQFTKYWKHLPTDLLLLQHTFWCSALICTGVSCVVLCNIEHSSDL